MKTESIKVSPENEMNQETREFFASLGELALDHCHGDVSEAREVLPFIFALLRKGSTD